MNAMTAPPSVRQQVELPVLLCNLCSKQLVTTCFLCACDCIFCEECTYGHFEQNSNCPTCSKHLSETDFREVNVVNASKNQIAENALTNYQTLFTKMSSASTNKALPLSDLCYSAIKQIESGKHSVRFVLKQLLVETTNAKKRYAVIQRSYENVNNNMTKMQQQHSADRLQLQQVNADLQQRLQAREQANADLSSKIKEQQRIIDQFQQYHNGRTAPSEGRLGTGQTHPASSTSHRAQHSMPPPLQGFIMQQEAQKQQQQQSYAASRQPNVLGSSRMVSSAASSRSFKPMNNQNQNMLVNGNIAPMNRPFTNSIRDLSSNTGYSFTGSRGSSGSGGNQPFLNKRRRVEPAPLLVGASPIDNMSPTTAFTLNQGPYNASTGGAHSMRQGFMRR